MYTGCILDTGHYVAITITSTISINITISMCIISLFFSMLTFFIVIHCFSETDTYIYVYDILLFIVVHIYSSLYLFIHSYISV